MTQIVQYQPSQNVALNRALTGLEAALEAAARANVEAITADGGYSQTEIQAMVLIDQLKQVNGLDLTAVLLRAKYVREIERTNAIANHPAGYTSRDEMARAQGISPTELSHTMDLVDVVFPYMLDTLGMNVALAWEEIGKSNMKELIPILKAIITGEHPNAATVQAQVTRVIDDVAASAQAAGQELAPEEIAQEAIELLLEQGANLTNRQLRQQIRPERTPSINVNALRMNGGRTIIASVNEEQWTLLQRKMGSYMDEIVHDLPEDPALRQIELARIREIRELVQMLEV